MTKVLSRVGFGTAALGAEYGLSKNPALSEAATAAVESTRLLEEARDCGITILDTASHYGQSESFVGGYLGAHPDYKPYVISKFMPKDWKKEIAQSKQRLGGNLKALLWHNFDATSDDAKRYGEKLTTALAAEMGPGIELGCSTYGPLAAFGAIESGLFKLVELEYNMLNRAAYEGVRDKARAKGVKLVIRSVLQKGFLTTALITSGRWFHTQDKGNAALREIGTQVAALAREAGVSVEELALRYVAATTTDEIILVGANARGQLASNVAMLTKPALEAAVLGQVTALTMNTDPKLFDLRDWR